MIGITGSWSAELDLDRLAEQIAQRTAVLVIALLRSARAGGPAGGTDVYERGHPDPGQASPDPVRGRHNPDDIGLNGLSDPGRPSHSGEQP